MIPNQPGMLARSLLAAAVVCAFLVPSAGARAEEPSSGGSREVVPLVVESRAASDAAVRPTTSISWSWIGSTQDSASVVIRFSQSVTDFTVDDIHITCTHPTAACAEADPPDSAEGTRFIVTMRMPEQYDGLVFFHIPANAVQNSSQEGNTASRVVEIDVDTRGPVFSDAKVNGDEVVIAFDEDLDQDFVPSAGDFQVSFRNSTVSHEVKTVSRVEVATRDVFLLLASPVDTLDAVRVFYDDQGADALRDLAGNRAFGFDMAIRNVTGEARTGVPGEPRNLTATADGPDVIELEWDEPSSNGGRGITGYLIEVSEDGGSTWSDLVRIRNTDTSYRDTGLPGGVTRHYRVSAINFNGTGDPSEVASATTEDVLPEAPRSFTAQARGDSAIELSWRAPSSSGSGPITGYRIEWSRTGTGGWGHLDDTGPTTTTYTDGGLRPATTRYYRVAATSAAGLGDWSRVDQATTDTTRPSAPIGLRARPNGVHGSTQILLTWTAPADDGGTAITGYRIEVSYNEVTWIPHVANTNSTATTYLHTGLSPGTTRFYRVSAVNGRGAGRPSNVAEGTTNAARPGQPQNVRARGTGPNTILLAWDPPDSDGGAPITGYSIWVLGPNDNRPINIRPNTGTTATTFTHPELQPATRYQYQVAAINSVGAGPLAPAPGARPAVAFTHADFAGAPTGLTAQAVGTSRVDLSWHAPRYTGGVSITGYRVEASDDGGETWNIIRRSTLTPTTMVSDVNLQPATTRHYRVAAINLAGFGPFSNVARATTDATLPGVPRGFDAEAVGTSQIVLSWRTPTNDGGAAINGYRIEVSEDGAATWADLVGNTRTTTTVYTHGGLGPASTRHYRVSAVNRVGVGNPSRIVSATTDATVPDAPTGLTATDVTPTQIDLAWVAPAYDGGAPISGYRVEVSETGAAWADLVSNTGSTVTTFSHTALQPGSVRHYRVSAINRAGTGAASASASAATDDPVQRAGRLNTRVLPQVAAAMTSSTVSAIASRVDAVANGMGMEQSVETNGLSSMAASLSAPGPGGLAQGDGAGLAALFGGTSFLMPFGGSDAPQQSATSMQMASWGAGEYHYMGEPGASALDWKGNMVSAHVGVDARIGSDLLAGVAGSYNSGSFDFTDKTGARPVKGTYGTTMTSAHPYVAWFPGARGASVWGSAGIGRGDIEVDDEREGLRTSPASTFTGAAGASYQLVARGTGGVSLKAEGWGGQFKVQGTEQIGTVTLDMQRAKLALELTQGFRTDTGHEMAFVLEGGMRYDNGDGVNGTSAEVGGGLRYTNSGLGLTAEGRGRFVISAREGYEEWGLGGMLMFDPAARGQGLQVRVAPAYGDHRSGVNQLWERGVSDAVGGHDLGMGANVDGEVAYGIAGFQGTPYSGFYLGESGMRAFSSGVRYDLGTGVGLRLEGTRRESALGAAQHSVGIRGRIKLR